MRGGVRLAVALVALALVAGAALWAVRGRNASDEGTPAVADPATLAPPVQAGVAPAAVPSSASTTPAAEGPLSATSQSATHRGMTVVILAEGKPASGALVRVGDKSSRLLAWARTDEAGRARFDDVDPEDAYLYVMQERCRPMSFRVRDLEDVAGERSLSLEPGIPFDGRVLDAESDEPIPNAIVRFKEWGEWYDVSPTDAQGRFHVPGVRPNDDTALRVSASGHVPAHVEFPVTADSVVPAEPVIRLARGGALVGIVHSADGRPVSDARIEVMEFEDPPPVEPVADDAKEPDTSDGKLEAESVDRFDYDDGILRRWGSGSHLRGVSDAAGRFRVEGLKFATFYRARAEASGRARSEWVRGIRASADAPERVVTLALRRAAGVVVRVSVPEGTSLEAKATVRLFSDGELQLPSVALDGGRFRFLDVPPGPAFAVVRSPTLGIAMEKLTVREGDALDVLVALRPLAVVEGSVVDSAGEPVAGAEVQVASVRRNTWRSDSEPVTRFLLGARKATTDEEGRFRVSGVDPGPSLLVASARTVEGKQLGVRDALRFTAPARDLRIPVVPRGSIRVTLRTPDGRPLVEEVKFALMKDHGGGGSSRTPEDGVFELDDEDDGEYTLWLLPASYAWLRLPVTIRDGAAVDLGTKTVTSGARLEGRVVDGAGKGLAGVDVKCRDVPFDGRWAKSDETGRFVLDRLAPGPLPLQVLREGLPTVFRTVDLAVTRDVEVVMTRPGTLRGSVLGVDGKPARTSIHLRRPGAPAGKPEFVGESEWIDSSDAGTFQSEIPTGRWQGFWEDEGGTGRAVGEWTVVEGKTTEVVIRLPAK